MTVKTRGREVTVPVDPDTGEIGEWDKIADHFAEGFLPVEDASGSEFVKVIAAALEFTARDYRNDYALEPATAVKLAVKHIKEIADAVATDAGALLAETWKQTPLAGMDA